MDENILKSLLIDSFEKEWNECSVDSGYTFSKRHNRRMKKIFRIYEKNVRKLNIANGEKPVSKVRFNRKTVMIAIMAIILALVAGCAVAMFVSDAFNGRIYSDNTEIFPINTSGCPETIEETYCLGEIPDSFELVDCYKTVSSVYYAYENKKTNHSISFRQLIKKGYSTHLSTDRGKLESIKINGYDGVYIFFEEDDIIYSIVIWDNGEYILELLGNLHKEEAIKLAESAKICEN